MLQFNQKNVSVISAVSMLPPSNIDLPPTLIRRIVPSKKINFAYSLLPIYYFSRAIGLLPFSIIRDANGKVQKTRVSAFDFFWFVTSICLYLFLASFCYRTMETPKNPNESLILIIGDNLLMVSMYCV